MNLLIYMLKVILVAAVFYSYYGLFLRNKKFHHYNRYYLLSITLISVTLPFINIPISSLSGLPANNTTSRMLSVITGSKWEDEVKINATQNFMHAVFTWQHIDRQEIHEWLLFLF